MVVQKKKPTLPEQEVEATTPFEQETTTSSSDEEEVSNESESESEDESDEEGEEPNVTPVAPVKPVVLPSSPKVRPAKSTQQPDLAPATAPKKRPGEESMAVSKKKIKKTRVAEEVVKKVPKTPQRVFSEDDEIAILKALLNYSAENSINPINSTDFHDFVKKSIDIDVDKTQLSRKIRSMKSKYKNNATKRNAHDQSCYEISNKIWGKSSSGGSELKKRKRIPQVVVEEQPNISLSQVAKIRDVVGTMCLNDDTFKQILESLSDDEARAAFEDRWKHMLTAQLELNYKRIELCGELMKSSLDDALGRNRG